MARRTRRTAAALALIVLGALGAAGTAGAVTVSCNAPLADASGATWRQYTGFLEGQLPAGNPVFQGAIPGVTATLTAASPGGTCESEQGGRELVTSPTGTFTSAPGVTVRRRLYVPAGGIGFARVVDTWTNPGPTEATVDPFMYTLGSVGRFWRASSSGDAAVDAADDWFVGADTASPAVPTQPVTAEIWNGAGFTGSRPQYLARFGASTTPPWASGDGNHAVVWPMKLPANSSRSLMHVYLVRQSGAAGLEAAKADAAALAASPDRLYAGLTAADQAKIVNWPALDADGDGRNIESDNCPSAANADQADTDGDGKGDACDPDADGDGLPDAIEAILGTNPLTADTDGDGKPDAADSCVKIAGAGPDGCPVAQSQALPGSRTSVDAEPPDTVAPVCAVNGVPKKMKRAAFLRGVTARIVCDEPAAVGADLLGSARSVRLAASYNLTLGSKSLRLGGGARTVKVKPSKRLVGKARKLTARLRIVTTDAAGNRATKVKTIKVK
jgi:hypothetical protein